MPYTGITTYFSNTDNPSTMSLKVLYAWELGDNYGHLSRGRAVGNALRKAGHPVLFAVRNTGIACDILSPAKLHFVQAPVHMRRGAFERSILNYADILLASGYDSDQGLLGLLSSWVSQMSLFGAQVVVADHSPTALLAARVLRIPVVIVGTGFEIPPDVSPFPKFYPSQTGVVPYSDGEVLERINRALRMHSAQPFEQLSELFRCEERLITSIGELDHYGHRSGVKYIGPLGSGNSRPEVTWMTTSQARVVAYLRGTEKRLTTVVSALEALSAEAVCVFPDAELSNLPSHSHIRLFNTPVNISSALRSASAVMSNGGAGVVNEALLAGIPLALFPQHDEQLMGSKKVAEIGAGLVLSEASGADAIVEALRLLAGDGRFRQAARNLAKANVLKDQKQAAMETVLAIERASLLSPGLKSTT